MATTDKGAIAIASLFCGDGLVAPFNLTNARIGVGDSSAVFAASQTDLQASTNKLRKALDSAPLRTSNSIDYTSTFTTAEANYTWLEIALFNSGSGDYMATRKVIALPLKTSSEQWTVTVTAVATAA